MIESHKFQIPPQLPAPKNAHEGFRGWGWQEDWEVQQSSFFFFLILFYTLDFHLFLIENTAKIVWKPLILSNLSILNIRDFRWERKRSPGVTWWVNISAGQGTSFPPLPNLTFLLAWSKKTRLETLVLFPIHVPNLRSANFSVMGQMLNIFGFASHHLFSSLLGHCPGKAE